MRVSLYIMLGTGRLETDYRSGWSTTILTSKGALYFVGVLDGLQMLGTLPGQGTLRTLTFPPGYPQAGPDTSYHEPTTAIREFSSGRSHILGLADSGRIWSWADAQKPALQIKFVDVEIKETSTYTDSESSYGGYGTVKKVLAGWNQSSALIHGIGIVLWSPVKRQRGEDETDTMLVLENDIIPKTNYQRTKGAARESEQDKALGQEVGQVLNYILLENFLVFVTDIGKVFLYSLDPSARQLIELTGLRSDAGSSIDVQGSFRYFQRW
jgi:SCF-associated factor 1